MTDKWAEARTIAKEVITHFEGRHLKSYIVKGEKWATIGIGEAIPMSQHPKIISDVECDRRFAAVFARKETALRREIPAAVLDKLTVGQLVCVLVFRYNVKDASWLDPACRTRKYLVAGQFDKFLIMHALWINGEAGPMNGLKRRRHVERDLGKGKALADIKKANWYMELYK